jgi:hypothetical protein
MNLDGFGSAFRPELRMMPSDSLAIENWKLAETATTFVIF